MKRFFRLMSITMQERMLYRAGFAVNLVTPLILLMGQFLLWHSIYGLRGGTALGSFTAPDMYAYILLAFMINSLLTWSSENTLSREIRSGTVTARRMRPAPFLMQTLADMCGNLVLQAVVNVTLVALAFAAFRSQLRLPQPGALGTFLPSLALAMALRMMMVSFFSLLCFFTTSHLGLTWTRTALTEFFSGALIPIALFPAWLQTLSYCLPFPLMLQVPVSIFLGQALPIPLGAAFALQSAWILAFFGLHQLLYGYIRKNVTLAGG